MLKDCKTLCHLMTQNSCMRILFFFFLHSGLTVSWLSFIQRYCILLYLSQLSENTFILILQVTTHTNVVFELLSIKAVAQNNNCVMTDLPNRELMVNGNEKENKENPDEGPCFIHLKGQMLFMEEWHSMVYLATPM